MLMDFVEKHLNDPFYLEGYQRVSLRSRIFRELVANLIAHREYTSPAPATMTIYNDRVEFKNPNIPHYWGRIDPEHFTPFAKNPTICKFLSQLGRYEELGSGVRNVTKYHPFYAPGSVAPTFTDENMFTVVVPLDTATQQVTPPVTLPVTLPVNKLMKLLNEAGAMGNAALRERLGLKDRLHLREHYVAPAMAAGLIEMTLPEKPNSRLQKYRLTDKGRAVLAGTK